MRFHPTIILFISIVTVKQLEEASLQLVRDRAWIITQPLL